MTSSSGATRFRLIAVCLLLVGLAFIQDPGFMASDTKFDLVASPGQFLSRALHLWDDKGAFGQLQNQAYGYLWPMGPFFLLGRLIDVPGWIVQRLWQALVLNVAFLGASRVARALGIRSDAARIVVGLAFALSPRMLTTLGPISIEAWPSALAPWVLLPLILGSKQGSTRRAAALSGLAVAMIGGVNAAATFAVLPMGIIWLLTRTSGPRRRQLMLWWPAFTLLGTLWWLVPLFLMGAYSPPFLDFIETTSVATFPTTLFDSLRGTSDWVPYVTADSRAGNSLVTTAYLALNSGIVLLLGFGGLLDRRNPHRRFLALSLVVGVLTVTAGHAGSVQGFFSGTVRDLLDGSLAPLRNVHKFDPIIRLPLVLGIGFVVDRLLTARAAAAAFAAPPVEDLQHSLDRINRVSVLAMTFAVVVGSALPALTGKIEPGSPVQAVPGYWRSASDWLAKNSDDGTALLEPGSTFGVYNWGAPKDEPLQYLARSSWAVRNAIPLSPPGNIRTLDAIEDRFAQGHGSQGLAAYLRRAGVQFLVVRNDLRLSDDVPDQVVVHQTLADSAGLTRVATFGPKVGGGAHLDNKGRRTLINGGWQASYPAVEIYRVSGTTRGAGTGGPPTIVAGGPEDLLDLQDLGVIGAQPVVLAADTPLPKALRRTRTPVVLTDGLRQRERFFARVHDGYSAVLTPGDVPHSGNPTRDYLDSGDARWSTKATLQGARSISASSSGSDSNAGGGTRRGQLPYAALDGSADTAWVSDPGQKGRPWWEVGLDGRRSVSQVTLTGGPEADDNQLVRVRTDHVVSRSVDLGPGESAAVDVDDSGTRQIRVEAAPGSLPRPLSLAEVAADGLNVTRRLDLPELPTSWGDPEAIVLRADLDARTGCVTVAGSVRCVEGRDRASEEPVGAARRVTLAASRAYVPRLRVRPVAGVALDELLLTDQPVNVTASSTAVPDVRASAVAAMDGNPATTWMADTTDLRPSLSLSWLRPKRVTGLSVAGSSDTAARLPTEVTLIWPRGRRTVELEGGKAQFPAIRTSQLRIQVDRAETAVSLDFSAQTSSVGVGIGELRLKGVPYIPVALPRDEVDYGCGSGPTIDLNGVVHQSSVTASPAQLATGEEVPAEVCGTGRRTGVSRADARLLVLAGGANDLTLTCSPTFAFDSLVLTAPGTSTLATGLGTRGVQHHGPAHASLRPGPGDVIADLGQNTNPGWQATQSGKDLDPVVLNGWQQGWALGDDSSTIRARFGPDTIYRWGLGTGLACLLALFGSVLVLLRRKPAEGSPALGERGLSPLTAVVVGIGASSLIAGWQGALIAFLVATVAVVLQDRWTVVAPWLLAAPCAVASFGYFLAPWGSAGGWAGNEYWPHYLMLVPFVSALVSAAVGRPRLLSLIAGTSRHR